ncbi:MAG: ParB/RepB/Spo0J family partition protein [Burkholderiales bacterium]|nr:ParB/RepB/Spo0J family partition protein [Burkholderiales bacterium]
MTKVRGLGRGLDALLANDEQRSESDRLQSLNVNLLQPGKYQPRTRTDEESLADLADSIKAQGVIQPILVRPIEGSRYEIIAGERRWRAARLAGLTEVPTVTRVVADNAALAMALIENIQRQDLNPLEEAAGIQRLIDEFGMTHQEASEAVGRSRSAVSNMLRLLALAPAVQKLLAEGKLDMGHARALLQFDASKQTELARQIVGRGLSVREAERLAHVAASPVKPINRAAIIRDRDILRLQEEVSQRLGANVEIKPKKKGGTITIGYSDLEQLDTILARL